MRSASDDSEPVLPWQLIRQDVHGNRYRVAGYATRGEAQQAAERLAATAARSGDGPGLTSGGAGPYIDGYLVKPLESPDPPDSPDFPDPPDFPDSPGRPDSPTGHATASYRPPPRLPRPARRPGAHSRGRSAADKSGESA